MRGLIRAETFRDYYEAQLWPIPPNVSPSYDAHHILPLAWGGSNDPTNGVFLTNGKLIGTNQHAQFSAWWCGFSIAPMQPSCGE